MNLQESKLQFIFQPDGFIHCIIHCILYINETELMSKYEPGIER